MSVEQTAQKPEVETNPFADPNGLVIELVDDRASCVHIAKAVRVNGLDISKWLRQNGVTITADSREATQVQLTFLAADVRTVDQ